MAGLLSHHTLVATVPSEQIHAECVPDCRMHFFFSLQILYKSNPQGFYLSGTKNGVHPSLDSIM